MVYFNKYMVGDTRETTFRKMYEEQKKDPADKQHQWTSNSDWIKSYK